MDIHQNIRHIRNNIKKIKLKELHSRIVELFGDDALNYQTLSRIERGKRSARPSSLYQICKGLDISYGELKEDTQKQPAEIDLIKRKSTKDRFQYNDNAYIEILINLNRNFIASELNLLPGGKTDIEQDPDNSSDFEKWIYCIQGEIEVNIASKVVKIKKADALSFKSHLPHYFENKTTKKSRCLIIQNPKHI